jgi:hypothetical protein
VASGCRWGEFYLCVFKMSRAMRRGKEDAGAAGFFILDLILLIIDPITLFHIDPTTTIKLTNKSTTIIRSRPIITPSLLSPQKCLSTLRLLLHLHPPCYPTICEHPLRHQSSSTTTDPNSTGSVMFASIGGPYSEILDLFDTQLFL